MNAFSFTERLGARIIATIALFSLIASLVPMQAFADHDPFAGVPQKSVELCHSGSGKNFVTNSPSITATGANINLAGHEGHASDIIPPFHFDTGTEVLSYSGKNWPAGQEIWENGCKDPDADYGFITVVKAFDGEQGPEDISDFTLEIDGEKVTSGTKNELVASKGATKVNYTISESDIPNDYDLVSISCVDDKAKSVGSGTGDVSFELKKDDDITCTITNKYTNPDTPITKGSITVKKDTNDASGDSVTFDFSGTNGLGSFSVNGNNVDSEVFSNLSAGSYTITENDETGWDYGSVMCTGADVAPVTNGVTVTLDAVDTVVENATCTFTNLKEGVPNGTLEVKKVILGNPSATSSDFSFTVNNGVETAFELDGSNTMLLPTSGTYTVAEVSSTAVGYNAVLSGACTEVTLAENQTSTCTVTNTWIPTCDDKMRNGDETGIDEGGSCGGGPTVCEDRSAQNYGQVGACVKYTSQCIAAPANLLTNGSFENPVVTDHGGTWEIFSTVAGWVPTLSSGLELWRGIVAPSDGLQNAELDGDDATMITQATTTIPGATYELRFDFAARSANAADNHIEAAFNGTPLVNASTTNTNWVTYGKTFVATGASTNISFADMGVGQAEGGTGTLLDNAVLCLVNDPSDDGGDDTPTYKIFGYVWHDNNRNEDWDGRDDDEEGNEEDTLSGWTITIDNGDGDIRTTTTDEDGYYEFNVPAGTWVITEQEESGWLRTTQESHTVTVPEVLDESPSENLMTAVMNFLVPTAHAQMAVPVKLEYGEYNFGNDRRSGGGGGGTRVGDRDGEVLGDSDSVTPEPLVLGEQTSVVPTGAPNTGKGGATATVVLGQFLVVPRRRNHN